MNVSQLIAEAIGLAFSRHVRLHKQWVGVGNTIGPLLPDSSLVVSAQRLGRLDIMLRCMEDEYNAPSGVVTEAEMLALDYQGMLSEFWVVSAYEITRLLIDRKIAPDSVAFRDLAHDLRLLRIPLEKHEIAKGSKLSEPLRMQKMPLAGDETDVAVYSKSDTLRAYLMPFRISERGSVMWNTIDPEPLTSHWIERRALSEQMLALWAAPASSDSVGQAQPEATIADSAAPSEN